VTPAAGIIVYAYQTDARGYYNEGRQPPRLHGWVRTDREGRFTLDTIRPGPYPGGRIPAHVHFQLWGAGTPPQWNTELLFDDDALVSTSDREKSKALGSFAFVHAPITRDGVLSVTHQMRLKAQGDRFGEDIMHGLRPCDVD
jgi:protocatechuate 3,4-dioxygenase beta subunit